MFRNAPEKKENRSDFLIGMTTRRMGIHNNGKKDREGGSKKYESERRGEKGAS